MGAPVRLQRYLATAGVAARRKAEDLIVAGRVTVNGAVVTVLGTKIDPDRDSVLVDGEAVVALDHFYVLFNKPKGCITAVTDDRGRPTVMDYLPNLPVPVKPVGRLDFYTEGVLLLTNDGELAARLLAPASHAPKTYHVKVHGKLRRAHVEALRQGITLDDGTTTMPAEIEILPGESKHTWLGITIHEGKHRQIHRMIEALGHQVDKLQRVAFANLTFHELRVGDARELTQQELNALRDTVGLDHRAIARGRWRAKREATDIPRRARAKARAEAEAVALGLAPSPPAGERGAGNVVVDDRETGGGADRSRTSGPSRSRAREPGRDRAVAHRSSGSFGQTRPRAARGSGGGRREDRDTEPRTAGGRWGRGTGGGGVRDAWSGPGPGRRGDAERGTRGRGGQRPRDAGPAGDSGGRWSSGGGGGTRGGGGARGDVGARGGGGTRGGGGARGQGQGRRFGPRVPPRGRKT